MCLCVPLVCQCHQHSMAFSVQPQHPADLLSLFSSFSLALSFSATPERWPIAFGNDRSVAHSQMEPCWDADATGQDKTNGSCPSPANQRASSAHKCATSPELKSTLCGIRAPVDFWWLLLNGGGGAGKWGQMANGDKCSLCVWVGRQNLKKPTTTTIESPHSTDRWPLRQQ